MFQTIDLRETGIDLRRIMDKNALSQFLQVPIDVIICGNRKAIVLEPIVIIENPRTRRLYVYYKQLNKMLIALELKHSWNDKHRILLH